MELYTIGKASRHKEGDIVSSPPYEKIVPDTMYDLLRSTIYTSKSQALTAAKICEDSNPVGFVILRVKIPTD